MSLTKFIRLALTWKSRRRHRIQYEKLVKKFLEDSKEWVGKSIDEVSKDVKQKGYTYFYFYPLDLDQEEYVVELIARFNTPEFYTRNGYVEYITFNDIKISK